MGWKIAVATACLNQWAMDFEGNYLRILDSIKKAKKQGARLRLGPELEVTSYGCGDHFHENDTFLHSWEVLAELLQHPDCTDIIIVLGMPVMHRNIAYNCQVVFLDRKLLLIRPKLMMCDDYNYRETRYFSPWMKHNTVEDFYVPRMITEITHQKTVPIGDALISTVDTCIGFEICEELFSSEPTNGRQNFNGVEVFCNSSASHHELNKLDPVANLIEGVTKINGGVYMYANLRGGDGERVYYNGASNICTNGNFVARAQQFSLQEVEVSTAIIDLEDVRMLRNSRRSRGINAGRSVHYPRISVNFSLLPPCNSYNSPSPPITIKYFTPEEEISYGPACWLWDYLRRSGQGGFFLPLSGGVDSSSTACIVYSMCNLVCQAVRSGDPSVLDDARRIVGDQTYFPVDPKEFCNRIFITCYMGTENSSAETKARSTQLSKQIGSYHLAIGIDLAVSALLGIFTAVTTFVPKFQSRGGSVRENLALQNVQARLRMVISYLFAQLMLWVRGRSGGLLVLGSANVDESLRGYFTKYDCSSADINPIGGINKTDLKKFLSFMKTKYGLTALETIMSAPPTAELEPLSEEGGLFQKDEIDMGMTYEELSTYGKLRKRNFCGPYSMFYKLLDEWHGKCTPEEIANKVKFFFRFYAINRHKMSVLTPSYHAETYSPDDNRYDHRQILYNTKWTWQFQAIDDKLKKLKMASENRNEEVSYTEKKNININANTEMKTFKNSFPGSSSSVSNNLNSENVKNIAGYLNNSGKVLLPAAYEDDDAETDYKMWEQIRKKYNIVSKDPESVSEFV